MKHFKLGDLMQHKRKPCIAPSQIDYNNITKSTMEHGNATSRSKHLLSAATFKKGNANN